MKVAPIGELDVPAVADFLHENLNGRVPAAAWASDVPWKADAPNRGMMLVGDDNEIAGALLAFYSEREIAGRTERFCNLGAWCVLPEHRLHSLKLLKALLKQPGFHFTDLSPSGNVVAINERLGFRFLDTTTALIPNLPWPTKGVATGDIRHRLGGGDLVTFLDHADAAAARQVVLTSGDRSCLVVFRRDRRKGLPLFASILHVSDPALFARMRRRFLGHLLLRHGIPFTLGELRIIGNPPRTSIVVGRHRRKMFRSDTLGPDDIDYLYSELVCLDW